MSDLLTYKFLEQFERQHRNYWLNKLVEHNEVSKATATRILVQYL